jgi:glucose-1-phosphate cytidylyltransferase
MQVVIFCGGQGTRLREETESRPKPMVQVGGHPIVWHIMKTYAHFGHKDFVLCLGYKGEMIKEYFLNYRAMNHDFKTTLGDRTSIECFDQGDEHDFNVICADTGMDAMTGARLKKVRKYITDDVFLVTYGDGLIDVDINQLIAFHKAHGKTATVTAARTISRFGILDMDDRGFVNSFAEKPDTESWINAGYFVFNRNIFDYISDDESCVLEKEVMQRLVEAGELIAFRHNDFFYAMDTYREYIQLNKLWDEGSAPWAHWRKTPSIIEKIAEEKVKQLTKNRSDVAA